MLEKIVADLAQDSQASEKQEKDAQSEYERSAKDAQEAREEATRSLAEKSGVKAGLEKRALGLQLKQQSNVDSKANVEKYLKALQEDSTSAQERYRQRLIELMRKMDLTSQQIQRVTPCHNLLSCFGRILRTAQVRDWYHLSKPSATWQKYPWTQSWQNE
eukprot:g27518.t1